MPSSLRKYRLISLILTWSAVFGRVLHDRYLEADVSEIDQDVSELLRSIGTSPRADSLRALATDVTRNQDKLAMLQSREVAMERQHDVLEHSVHDMEQLAKEADGDVDVSGDAQATTSSASSGVQGVKTQWVNAEPQMVDTGPTMADAGRSGFQQTMEDATEHLVSLALAGLTGVRASIPIFIFTVRSKTSGGSAIDLRPGFEWLYSIPALITLSCLMAIELICDCIPVVSEAMDAAMLFVKPAVALVIALAPEYGNEGISGVAISAGACCILALIVAVFKAAVTKSVETQSSGHGHTPARSFLEDVAVAALSLISMGFTIIAGLVVVCLVFLLISYGCFRGRTRSGGGKPAARRDSAKDQASP